MLGWHDKRKLSSLLPSKEASAIKRAFGFTTAEQLLTFYPRKYAAHGVGLTLSEELDNEMVTLVGCIVSGNAQYDQRGNYRYEALIATENSTIKAVFFRTKFIANVLKVGTWAMFTGKIKAFRGEISLQHPDYVVLPNIETGENTKPAGTMASMSAYGDTDAILTILGGMDYIPIYPGKRGMPTWRTLAAVHEVLINTPEIPDPLGTFIPQGMPTFDQAIRGIHQPNLWGPEKFVERMRYNEALEIAAVMAVRKADSVRTTAYSLPPRPEGFREQLLDNLPFQLTPGQTEVLAEISDDLGQEKPMSRLLQGEVGSGKTIVSLLAMLQAVDNDKQCALLAPTEVLAVQHSRSIQSILGHAHVDAKVVLLTGSLPTKQKQEALLSIVSGDADIVVGTHAIIQEGVEFYDLALSIVDEQHRFGVEQRNYLRSMGRDNTTPHLLVMTATPIPRTIAMTAFGDLSQSTLKQLPGGRKPIQSFVISESNHVWMTRAFERMREEIASGHQIYVVCHRIQGEGGVEETFQMLSHGAFHGLHVDMLHGKMHPEDKDRIMQEFALGHIDVLVSTTVIEVGIDVPNATVMLIRNSENFGVSQLHQLRGRVGRGGNASLCFFHLDAEAGEQSVERVNAVASTNDGFELAEIDLQYRQEGDVLGAAQSGVSRSTKLLSLIRDKELIAQAHRDAKELEAKDPDRARAIIVDIDVSAQEYLDKS